MCSVTALQALSLSFFFLESVAQILLSAWYPAKEAMETKDDASMGFILQRMYCRTCKLLLFRVRDSTNER